MQSLDEILDIGNRLVDSAMYEEAIGYFSKAIELYPNDPHAYDLRGIAYFRILKVDDAINDMKSAISQDHLFHLAYFHLAEIYMEYKDFKKAEDYCNQALKIEPQNDLYQATIAYIKLQLKEDDQCIKICDEILNFNQTNTYALEYRAIAYMNKKDFKKAIPDLEALYGNTKEDSVLLNNLGYSYSKIGETKISKNYLLLAIKLDPGYSYPYDNLGYVYMLERNFKKAHELIDKSLELDPTNSYAFKNKALVFIEEKDLSSAIAALEKAKALRFDLYYGNEVDILLSKLRN